jgi:aspartate/methionine/tyrosine aminotransferase
MRLAQRMSRLGTETAFEVLVRARALEAQGRDVVHLEIGEPDFDTPAHVIAAAQQALGEGWTHYGPAAGLPELRETIAEHIAVSRGMAVAPDEVVVEPGAKPVIFYTMLALLEPGDEVLYPNPGFPIYESMINFLGAKPVPLRFVEDSGRFRLDLSQLKDLITERTRLLILNSPHNPTGAVIPEADLQEIAAFIAARDIAVLSDEIYCRILYEGRHASIATLPGMRERTILLDGFSKTYAMTGWRLGYAVMPRALAEQVTRLGINNHSCTASFTQRAGIAALRGPQDAAARMVEEFRRRRDRIVAGLNRIPGFRCPMPQGAFYVFPNITATGMKSKELATALLEEGGVACLAGTAFGACGEGYLRFSYANSIANIEKALARVEECVTVKR